MYEDGGAGLGAMMQDLEVGQDDIEVEGAGPNNVVEDEGAGLIDMVKDEGAGLVDVVEDKGVGLGVKKEDEGAGRSMEVRRIKRGGRRTTRWVKVILGG